MSRPHTIYTYTHTYIYIYMDMYMDRRLLLRAQCVRTPATKLRSVDLALRTKFEMLSLPLQTPWLRGRRSSRQRGLLPLSVRGSLLVLLLIHRPALLMLFVFHNTDSFSSCPPQHSFSPLMVTFIYHMKVISFSSLYRRCRHFDAF